LPRFKRLQSALGPYIGREVLASRMRAIRKGASTISRGRLLEILVLSLMFVVALAVRLLPLRFGFYLSEFDPYLQWRMSEYIVKNGFLAWFSWHDTMSWYPWGLTMATGNLYGVAFTVAAVYEFLRAIGVNTTVFEVAVLFPVVAGALTSLASYFLGKDLWGRGAGLLAALFMALNPSNISRTTLGFLRHEPLGILLMILVFLFFLRANQKGRGTKGTIGYSMLAGLSLFYLTAAWAASYYPMDLIVLYVAALVVAGRYTRQLLLSYSVTYGALLFLAPLAIPKMGFGSLTSLTFLVIPGVLILLLAREAGGTLPTWRHRAYALIVVSVVLLGLAYALATLKIMELPSDKFLSTLNPFTRLDMPIVASVSEHRPATWASFFYEYNTLTFLGLFGFFFILRRLRDTDIFITIAALTSLYFSGSLVRLTLILAPTFSILAAIATVEMAKPAVDILRQAVIFPKRRIPGLVRIGREFGLAVLLILIIAIVPAFSKAVAAAYAPATIATSSIPVVPSEGTKYQDWLEALAWLHDNTPQSSVVMAWWDYGYWITALADRKTLADNGTQNTTQIAMIAQMFMRNETTAVPMMQKYNVDYVVVFVTYARTQSSSNPSFLGAGEDGKWYWMVQIANETSYGDQTILFQTKTSATTSATGASSTTVTYYRILKSGNKIISNDTISSGQNLNDNSVLGFMMNTGVKISQATSDYFDNVFISSNNFVLVYKVLYPKTTVITLNVDRNRVNFGESVSIKGTVTDSDGKPYVNGTIALADLMTVESGLQLVAYVPVSDGKFSYDWTPSTGNHTLSAHWQGLRGETRAAASNSVQVFVQALPVALTISLSTYNVTLGQNVTISMKLSQKLSNGTLTAQYSLNNKTWSKLEPIEPKDGAYDLDWHPITAGTYYVKATYSGSGNYGPATSNTVIVYVEP
jgi:dolichyl-diphosphooligosaccharide--protein glycosyltransferase